MPERSLRTCRACRRPFPATLEYFSKERSTKLGLMSQCKSCRSAKKLRHYNNHRNSILSERRQKYRQSPHLRRTHSENARKYRKSHRFAVSLNQSLRDSERRGHLPCLDHKEILAAAFTGKCHICGVPEQECHKRLFMDHCHSTGQFRGWLCHSCHSRVSLIERFVSDERFVAYLNRTTSG